MGDRCTGSCCERFRIGGSPGRWAERVKILEAKVASGKELTQDNIDELKIGRMIIPLPETAVDVGGTPNDAANGSNLYTCKHFDTVHKLCMNYEDRPTTCKTYPYARPCEFPTCNWDIAREGKAPQLLWARKAAIKVRAVTQPYQDIFHPPCRISCNQKAEDGEASDCIDGQGYE